MLVKVVFQCIPPTSNTNHNMAAEYPYKDEHFGITDPVLSIGNPDHWKLGWAGTSVQEIYHPFVKRPEVVRDDLRSRRWVFVRRTVLQFGVDLLFELHQERGKHAHARTSPSHFQQAEDETPLVLAHHQVFGLEEQTLLYVESAAEGDEVGHVVTRLESASLHVCAVNHVPLGQREQRGLSLETGSLQDLVGVPAENHSVVQSI